MRIDKKVSVWQFMFVGACLMAYYCFIYSTKDCLRPSDGGSHVQTAGTLSVNRIVSQNSTGKGTDIMLVAYMRTGSTFIGDVLGRREDVFYWFEPLHKQRMLQYLRGRHFLCNYFRPICQLISIHDSRSGVYALDLLTNIFNCNITGTIEEISGLKYIWHTPRMLEKSCTNAKHRMVKVLRMDLETLAGLLHTNPRLKIVLLLRDPRGSMNSHLTTTWYKGFLDTDEHVNDDALVLCSRLLNDIKTGKRLQLLHPDRMIIIQYEDIDTENKMEALSKLVDLDKLGENTFKLVTREDHVGTANSGFHPFNFRQQLNWTVNVMMNRHCADVYKELGLRQFDREEDLRDETIPVVINKLPFSVHMQP
ncbi:hypothetical protein MAR_034203 [Mya arenaria]|uniref:Sulfotransferase domain-containing protein n=1 Tax=Mya arenaria TaxID=6604 RepID=A0ABY7GJN3_MYAAR|nr:hypothetical protein MAR_034203 [Mya arenaria]